MAKQKSPAKRAKRKKSTKVNVKLPSSRERHIAAFLKAYTECGSIFGACEVAGLDRTIHYIWLKEVPSYPERFQAAIAAYADLCAKRAEHADEMAYRRGVEGTEEVIGLDSEGNPIIKRVYSDRMHSEFLKAWHPRYRSVQEHKHSGNINSDVSGEVKLDGKVEITHKLTDKIPKLQELIAQSGVVPDESGSVMAGGEPEDAGAGGA